MHYSRTRLPNLDWVATISDDNGNRLDTSVGFVEKVDAMKLRDAAKAAGVSKFAELDEPLDQLIVLAPAAETPEVAVAAAIAKKAKKAKGPGKPPPGRRAKVPAKGK